MKPQMTIGLLVLGGLVVAAICVFVWNGQPPASQPTPGGSGPAQRFTGATKTENPWLNAKSDVAFVGSQKCTQCHEAEHASYLMTAHSQALSPVDIEQEPANAAFTHEASGRHYEVRRRDGRLYHRESMVDENGEPIAAIEHPLDWLIGSGRHSRSYLVDLEGYLSESPVTWYTSRKEWGMSPGYDRDNHWGFERPANRGCLFCHVGSTEPVRDGFQKLKIGEQAIGCERCHGPGGAHVARWEQESGPLEGIDRTIVNPAHLSRTLAEDICAQCHVRGDATVAVRGKDLTDFRPGMALAEVRVDYRIEVDNRPMKVVGHVEQMRLSKCYQQSDTLSCTTCHDPHRPLAGEEAVAAYRKTCLSCHQVDACKVPAADPRRATAGDNCASCHMPQVPTDIPHIAFTHHRIGIHKDEPPPPPQKLGDLVAWSKLDHLSEWEQKRCRALGYLEVADQAPTAAIAAGYRNRALKLLEEVRSFGLADPDVSAGMARILWQKDPQQGALLAQAALDHPGVPDTTKVNSLYLLGEILYGAKSYRDALVCLQQLGAFRRHSEDHLLQALCWLELQSPERALASGQKAAAINPFRPEVHELLVEVYRRLGRPEQVREHTRIAEHLRARTSSPAPDTTQSIDNK